MKQRITLLGQMLTSCTSFAQIILAATIVTTASSSFARSISCQVKINTTSKSGYLMPLNLDLKVRTLTTKEESLDRSKCSRVKAEGLNLLFCAREANYVGGFEAALFNTGKTIEDIQMVSMKKFGTLKSDGSLTEIYSTDQVLESFLDKVRSANIESPSDFVDDSSGLDEAVKIGSEKGLFTEDEPVLLMLRECH